LNENPLDSVNKELGNFKSVLWKGKPGAGDFPKSNSVEMPRGIVCKLHYQNKEVYIEITQDPETYSNVAKILDDSGSPIKQMKGTWSGLDTAIKALEKFGKVEVLGTWADAFGVEDNIGHLPV
jgi:hypothetical protein